MYSTEYGFGAKVKGHFDDIVEHTIEALSDQGFGVLSDIDVKKTLKKKIDVDFKQYRILGACNPPLAHRALLEEAEIGLLLPCNVIVYEANEDECAIVAIDPVKNLDIVGNSKLEPLAEEVHSKLKAVIASLEPVAEKS